MILIVRVQTKDGNDSVWNYVLENLSELQKSLKEEGKFLYLSRRANHKDTSIFIELNDTNDAIVVDFITKKISTINGVDGIWVLHLFNVKFFPIPEGTSKNLLRYTLTVRAYPQHLSNIFDSISDITPTANCVVTYAAYTFHLFGDCLQCSVLVDSEATVQKFAKRIESLPGVLKTTLCQIEKTHRLVSQGEWLKHISEKYVMREPGTSAGY